MSKQETKGNLTSKYFNLPNPGLRSYFSKVVQGQPDVYRTTFAGRQTNVADVLQQWEPTLRKLEDRWPTLVEFEMDLAKKVGPMSVMKPLSERMEDIDHYYDDISKSSEPISEEALRAVESEWSKLGGLRPRSQKRTLELMKKSTNSGSPYFAKRKTVITKTYPCRIDDFSPKENGTDIVQYLPNGEFNACAVLGWRGQEGGPKPSDVKQRVVWMFPFAVNLEELTVYQPLIEGAQRFNLVPAWVSMDAVDDEITKLFDSKGKDDLIICTDFSRFDQHFNEHMQLCAREFFEWLLSCKGYSKQCQSAWYWLNTIFPIKYSIPLMYDYGKVRYGLHGMGSGSGGTNADETIVHRALQHEVALAHHQQLNPHSQCLGDDGILTYPGITVDDVVQAYSSHGQEMNKDKQYASKHDCVYLRRWHHEDYRIGGKCKGVYSTNRALGRLCMQERYYDPDVWSKEMVALRQLSIIENVKWHPLRDEFAEFCMARDKYRLGLDIPGFLDKIDSIAQEAMELMPDFIGYTKTLQKDAETGISSWWIVQYLRSRK